MWLDGCVFVTNSTPEYSGVYCILPHLRTLFVLLVLHFSQFLLFLVGVLVVLCSRIRHVSIFAYLDYISIIFGFALVSRSDHRICISINRIKNQDGHWGTADVVE